MKRWRRRLRDRWGGLCEARLLKSFFLFFFCFCLFVGQGLSIKDTVPISDDEGVVFLKLTESNVVGCQGLTFALNM